MQDECLNVCVCARARGCVYHMKHGVYIKVVYCITFAVFVEPLAPRRSVERGRRVEGVWGRPVRVGCERAPKGGSKLRWI